MDNKVNSWLIDDVYKLEYKVRIRSKRENKRQLDKCSGFFFICNKIYWYIKKKNIYIYIYIK